MSERLCAFLLRFYPDGFLKDYEGDALQLCRDRLRDESSLRARLRLCRDLLADFAISLPLEWRRTQPRLIAAHKQVAGAPAFLLLEHGTPRVGAQLCAGLLSVAAFGSISLMIGARGGYAELLARVVPPSQQAAPTGMAQLRDAQPKPEDATRAIIAAFSSHNIVMFGEAHGNKQEYEWLDELVSTPAFEDKVDDIVVEFGNSLYQKSVDRYIAGEDVPLEQVRKAWRNVIGSVGPPSPVYEQFYHAVRDANHARRGKHQLRIVLGDPYGDWDKIKDAEDLGPYLAHRDEWYAQVVKDEVLAKNHHALLIMGAGHFLRRNGPGLVEREIRAAGANPWLVVLGTNAVGGYDDLDRRFDAFPLPAIVQLAGNWLGDLPAMPVVNGGTAPRSQLKLGESADALLYLGARDTLTQLRMPRAELDGTAYGAEMARRLTIEMGHAPNFLYDESEVPQFPRPQPQSSLPANSAARQAPPQMPKSMHDPLPLRPPSQ
jgi:hypothetical protein